MIQENSIQNATNCKNNDTISWSEWTICFNPCHERTRSKNCSIFNTFDEIETDSCDHVLNLDCNVFLNYN